MIIMIIIIIIIIIIITIIIIYLGVRWGSSSQLWETEPSFHWPSPNPARRLARNGQHSKSHSFRAMCAIYDIYFMGVSENSVPLNPMVNDHYPY